MWLSAGQSHLLLPQSMLRLLPVGGDSFRFTDKTRLREFRLNRGNGFVPICKCGEWNGQGCNYGLKMNVSRCDGDSTPDADAGDSGSGADLKYLFFCFAVLWPGS
jgi:hypothetical protein